MKRSRYAELVRSSETFFAAKYPESNGVMLAADAAIDACRKAATSGLVITRIEGGIFRNPGFEARLDCIWDGADPPLSADEAHQNNLSAASFVESESVAHDAFLLLAPPITHRFAGG